MGKKIINILYNKPFLLFLLLLAVAYLPVFLPFFHLKNDVLTQNLPTRFVFGESIYSGFAPYWNPFLNYGTPQYGDMNNGFWNPLQWLIGSTVGYNIYSITFEEMFYILIGSWGIYKCCRELFDKNIALLTGCAYMCCGVITGHMQYFCWITGAGYFPYVLLYFVRVHKSPSLRNFLSGGLSVFLFISSSHPGLTIGAIYLFFFLLILIYWNRKNLTSDFYTKKFWKTNALLFLTGSLLSTVVIFSNVDVLTHISRGSKVSLEQTLWHPTTLQSYFSLLFPLAVNKTDFFATDIAMRNAYIGIPSLIGVLFLVSRKEKKLALSILIPLLFFVLLASGGYFKMISWKVLPLLGFVRLNGEFTYFVVLILLFAGAYGLQKYRSSSNEASFIRITNILLALSIVCFVLSLFGILLNGSSAFFNLNTEETELKMKIKLFFKKASFGDLLLIQSVIQVITIYLLRSSHVRPKRFFGATIVNFIIVTWLTLPYTGLGIMSKEEIQKVIQKFPRGTYIQPLISIKNAKYIEPADNSQFLLIASYSKKIGSVLPDQYPVILHSNINFKRDSQLYDFIQKQSYLFLSSDTTIAATTQFDSTTIKVLKSGAGYTKCIVNNGSFKWLTFLQNDYPYWEVTINGKEQAHYKTFKTFISVPVEKGYQEVEFKFNPGPVKKALYISLFLIALSFVCLAIPALRNKLLFK